MNPRKKLLVALDFGPHSDAILYEALELAESIDATIHVLHAFTLQDMDETVSLSPNLFAHFKTSRHSLLLVAGARCRARGRLGTLLWHEGDPAAQILLTAAAVDADMIVIGASRRRPLTRLRLGSVTEAVVRKAECTIMVVREKRSAAADN